MPNNSQNVHLVGTDLLLKICANLIEILNKIIFPKIFSPATADHKKISLENGCCLSTT